MDCLDEQENEAISADDVAQYLTRNPDFFFDREDLLLKLRLPHERGEAVSLVERQVSILRDRNHEMRNRLNSLLDTARDNDKLFDKTKSLILTILEAQSIDALVGAVTGTLCRDFDCDASALILFAEPEASTEIQSRTIAITQAHEHIGGLLKANKAVCGKLRDEEVAFFFAKDHAKIGSAAVVPLSHGNPLGVLAIGSCDPNHFRSSMGTLFLNYLSEVLNRTLPPLIKGELGNCAE